MADELTFICLKRTY